MIVIAIIFVWFITNISFHKLIFILVSSLHALLLLFVHKAFPPDNINSY